jgi:hypothetical protein
MEAHAQEGAHRLQQQALGDRLHVRNLSAGVALLLVKSLVGVPDSFDLTIDSDNTTHAASVMGKRERSGRR